MGNYFDQKATPNAQLIEFIRQLTLPTVQKVQKYIQHHYPVTHLLTVGEFFDIYHDVLLHHCGTMFEILENNHSSDGQTDIYESLAVLVLYGFIQVVFADADFSIKVKFIAQMFDLDKSQKLEKIEVVMIFQTAIRALCKVVNMKPPGFGEIEDYVEAIFLEIDKNLDRTLSYEELYQWLDNNYQLQDFLLKYGQVQTFQNAKRRTNEIFNSKQIDKYHEDWLIKYTTEAQNNYGNIWGKQHLNSQHVKDEINYAYSAFKATDINNDGTISIRELPYLIYGFEGVVVKEIKKRFTQLDKDRSGTVTLQEWLSYLQLDSGIELCKSITKRYFMKMDSKNSGVLNNHQIMQVLKDSFHSDAHDLYFKGFESYINEHSTLDKMTIQKLQDFIEGPMIRIIHDKQGLMEKEKERKQAQNQQQ